MNVMEASAFIKSNLLTQKSKWKGQAKKAQTGKSNQSLMHGNNSNGFQAVPFHLARASFFVANILSRK